MPPFSSPGNLPNPKIKHVSPALKEDYLCKFILSNLKVLFKKKLLFMYLAGSDLSCGTQDLQSSLQHMGSSSLTRNPAQSPALASTEPQPLDQQGSPKSVLIIKLHIF